MDIKKRLKHIEGMMDRIKQELTIIQNEVDNQEFPKKRPIDTSMQREIDAMIKKAEIKRRSGNLK